MDICVNQEGCRSLYMVLPSVILSIIQHSNFQVLLNDLWSSLLRKINVSNKIKIIINDLHILCYRYNLK